MEDFSIAENEPPSPEQLLQSSSSLSPRQASPLLELLQASPSNISSPIVAPLTPSNDRQWPPPSLVFTPCISLPPCPPSPELPTSGLTPPTSHPGKFWCQIKETESESETDSLSDDTVKIEEKMVCEELNLTEENLTENHKGSLKMWDDLTPLIKENDANETDYGAMPPLETEEEYLKRMAGEGQQQLQ